MIKKILFYFFCFYAVAFNAQTISNNICPGINAGADITICNGQCTNLMAAVSGGNQTTSYTVSQIPYTPFPYTSGTAVALTTDDIWSSLITLPFNFCFFGTSHNKCIIGSNGQLSFNTTNAGLFDTYTVSAALPSSIDMPGNTICVFRDIDISLGGNAGYYITGTSPCRAMVIYYNNVPLFDKGMGTCDGTPNATFQIVLYENTNYIDVYIQESYACTEWNSGHGIIGIQNAAATVAVCPPNRNYPSLWTATNEAWRFIPTGVANYTSTWHGPTGTISTNLKTTVCPTVTSTYTAIIILSNCDGITSSYNDELTVYVNPISTVTANITSNSVSYCAGSSASSSATLTATGGLVYSWVPSLGLSADTGSVVIANPITTTVYTVTGSNGGCAGVATSTVMVNPIPIVSATFDTVCVGGSATITASGATNYTWSPSTSLSSTSGNSVVASPSVTTIYTITASANGCAASATIPFTVVQQPTVTVTSTSLTCSGICNGYIYTYSSASNNTYLWNTGATTYSLSNLCAGTYSVKITNHFCSSIPVTETVTVLSPTPVVDNISHTNSTCSSGNGSITGSASGGTAPYMYNVNTSIYSSINTVNTLAAGTYTVHTKDSKGCISSSLVTITQAAINNPTITVNSDTLCTGDSLFLTAQGTTTYTWFPIGSLSNSHGASVVATPTSTTIYTVTGTDNANCNTIATSTVLVMPANSIFCTGTSTVSVTGEIKIHNVFSPNNDGLNELFIIDNITDFPSNHVYIYNRWGQLIWHAEHYNNTNVAWNGTSEDGTALYAGTYYYIVEIVGKKNAKGWVELTK